MEASQALGPHLVVRVVASPPVTSLTSLTSAEILEFWTISTTVTVRRHQLMLFRIERCWRRMVRGRRAGDKESMDVQISNLDRFVREKECGQITGLSRPTRWRLERDGKFPKRRRISPNAIGWLASELEEWLRSREHRAA
jgi:prophage regulatory protein